MEAEVATRRSTDGQDAIVNILFTAITRHVWGNTAQAGEESASAASRLKRRRPDCSSVRQTFVLADPAIQTKTE